MLAVVAVGLHVELKVELARHHRVGHLHLELLAAEGPLEGALEAGLVVEGVVVLEVEVVEADGVVDVGEAPRHADHRLGRQRRGGRRRVQRALVRRHPVLRIERQGMC